MQETLKPHKDTILGWLNSSGMFALQRDPGVLELSIVASFGDSDVSVVGLDVFVQVCDSLVCINTRNEYLDIVWSKVAVCH